jgi:hypothetical protein
VTTVKRPTRLFSFTDWNRSRPKDPLPGDRVDAQVNELIVAITSTQTALAQIRRDDGQLPNNSVGPEQLQPGVIDQLTKAVEVRARDLKIAAETAAISAMNADRTASLYARDAESAAISAAQYASAVRSLRAFVDFSADVASRAAASTDVDATDAENWANYSQAQAENAIAAKDEALQWAEYLAGPVVNALDAPDYITGSKYPHGYFYQPVQGMGGMGGLWSAKWWALQAWQVVGSAAFYYLGGWDHAPAPGEQNPATGQVVPKPLPTGAMYYDTVSGKLMVWTGTSWTAGKMLAPGFSAQYVYTATAGQTVFAGADNNGQTPSVDGPSDVHVNGVRLVDTVDYTVDAPTATLTLAFAASAGSVVQWDVLVSSSQLASGAVNAHKILTLTPDGTTQDFTLQYTDPTTSDTVDAAVGDGAQLQVSLDGVLQEPGGDYTASGNTLHFAVAPLATAHLWAVWYQSGAAA